MKIKKVPERINISSLRYLEHLLKINRANLRQLADTSGRYYAPFDLYKKSSSKWRHIDNPQQPLKEIQKKILATILEKGINQLPNGMNGAISGKSIIDNVKVHVEKECIGVVDIKDCFPNTDNLKVYQVWRNFFFCGIKTANILTKLTTFQHRLPQGAPTSPLLCNYVLSPMFIDLKGYAKKNNLDASIFIDDITVSGKRKAVERAIKYVIKLLIQYKYSVRKRKVRIITSGYRQKVTGVLVNKKLSIGRKHVQQIRNMILETASLKGHIPSSEYNKIKGKVSFAKLVSKTQGEKLEKFAEKLLLQPQKQVEPVKDDVRRDCKKYSNNHEYIKGTRFYLSQS